MKPKRLISVYIPACIGIILGTISVVRSGNIALMIVTLFAGAGGFALTRWAVKQIESRDIEIARLREMLPNEPKIESQLKGNEGK